MTKHRQIESSGYYLYVMQSVHGIYKIGISNDPTHRLKTIKTSSPYSVKLLFSIACQTKKIAMLLERHLHTVLSQYNTHGEWFEVAENELGAILFKSMADFSCGEVELNVNNLGLYLREKSYIGCQNDALVSQLKIFVGTLKEPWIGSATELLNLLNAQANYGEYPPEGWPNKPNKLSYQLRNKIHVMRSNGIDIHKCTRTPIKRTARWKIYLH